MKHARIVTVIVLLLATLLFTGHAGAVEGKLVNINAASAADLAAVKGIGQVKAHAIVEYREKNGPFKSVDDLVQIRGIGEKLLTTLRPQLTVDAGAAPAPAAPASAKR